MPVVPKRNPVLQRPLGLPRPAAPPKWLEMTLTLPVTKDGVLKTRDVLVKRLGTLAVHRATDGTGYSTVTSITTGQRLTWVEEEADALKIAEVLWLHCREALLLSIPSEVCHKLPKWAIPWCVKCRELLAWCDYKEYQ